MYYQTVLALLLFSLFSCKSGPYDTSSPEKFVSSMGLIGQQEEPHNPLPYFYDAVSAKAILEFDELGAQTLESFTAFRNALSEQFPQNTKVNTEEQLKVALDGPAGMQTGSFSYSATLIGAQLKERKASDYVFVSATEPDEEGIVQLRLQISGNETSLPIKQTKDGYRMFLSDKVLGDISNAVEMLERLDQVFSEAHAQLVRNEITEANFEEELLRIVQAYQEALGS